MCLSICIYIINAQWEGAWARRSIRPPVRVHELGQFEGQPFCGLRIENVCIPPVLFFLCFFFLVLAVPNFFYSDFSYSSNLIFLRAFFFPALLVVLVGLCRWLRIIFGLVHDVMAKGRWVQERSECTYAWYVFWRLPPVKTRDPIAIKIGDKIRLAKISDLINDVNSTHLGKSIWIIQIRFVI